MARHIAEQSFRNASFIEGLERGSFFFVRLLESEDGVGIEEAFEEANGFRSQLPERRKGMIAPLFDLHIDVPDHPGIIGRIATELGDQGINLSNVQIIESREDVPGIMRLSFRQENDMERAKVLPAAA